MRIYFAQQKIRTMAPLQDTIFEAEEATCKFCLFIANFHDVKSDSNDDADGISKILIRIGY